MKCSALGAGDEENTDPNQQRTAYHMKTCMLTRNMEGESISTPKLSPHVHYNTDNIVEDMRHERVAMVNTGKRRKNFHNMIKQYPFEAETLRSFKHDGVGANSNTISSQGGGDSVKVSEWAVGDTATEE